MYTSSNRRFTSQIKHSSARKKLCDFQNSKRNARGVTLSLPGVHVEYLYISRLQALLGRARARALQCVFLLLGEAPGVHRVQVERRPKIYVPRHYTSSWRLWLFRVFCRQRKLLYIILCLAVVPRKLEKLFESIFVFEYWSFLWLAKEAHTQRESVSALEKKCNPSGIRQSHTYLGQCKFTFQRGKKRKMVFKSGTFLIGLVESSTEPDL